MWVEKRNKNYRMYERYTDLEGNIRKVSVSMDRDTPQQRNIAKAKLGSMIEKKQKVAQEQITFRQLCDLYLFKKHGEIKESTHRRNSRECTTLCKMFGEVRVEDLTSRMVRNTIVKYSKRPSMANEHIRRFKEIIKWGYQNDLVENPSFIDKITMVKDKSRREKIADKFLEKEECEKLVEGMTPTGEFLTRFLILSGLRIGEALALTQKDIDLQKREISVTKTKDQVTGVVTSPKTFCSIRQVYVQDQLLKLLTAHFTANRTLSGRSDDPVFVNEVGEPMEYDGYRKYLRIMSIKNIGRPITPHVLRHTHASLLAENDVKYETIARRLGHENSKVTRDIYIHVTENLKKKDNDDVREVILM